MSTFLANLKQQSAQMTAKNGTRSINGPMSPNNAPPIGNTDPNKGPVLISDLIKQNQAQKEAPLVITCERVLNRNRLDVFFSRKPGDEILQKLKAQGFRDRDTDKGWFHFDSEDNRAFCTKEFGAVFEDDNTPDNIEAPAAPIAVEATVTPEYETFKRQVNELIEYMKVEPADLMLLAVNTLHKKVFGKDA